MRRVTQVILRPTAAGLLTLGALSKSLEREEPRCSAAAAERKRPSHPVVERLGGYLQAIDQGNILDERAEKRGVRIFSIASAKDAQKHQESGGLSVVRIAQATIKVPVEDVANLWFAAGRRKEWDDLNTMDSQLVRSKSDSERLVYLKARPKVGGVVSSRDFVYSMLKLPGDTLGAPVGSVLFVQTDAATDPDVPNTKDSVRANVNSLLLLEPIDAGTTRVSYAIEMDAKGWLPHKVKQKAADELPLTIAVMRQHLEAQQAEQSQMGAEDLAQLKLKQEQQQQQQQGASASREELLVKKRVLEAQLRKIKGDERTLGKGTLKDLKDKLLGELEEVNRRL